MGVGTVGSAAARDAWNAVEAASPVEPQWLAAGAVALLIAAYGGYRLVSWYRRPPGVRLQECLASPAAVTVLLHPNPDPDAMACGMAIARLAGSVGTDATLQFPGKIRHQENRAFRTVLDLELERVETVGDLADGEVVLVDHNEARGFQGAAGIDPYAVVDHHPGGGEGRSFTDVRPEYGACASILAEYFRELEAVVLEPDDDEGSGSYGALTVRSELATALVYGIQSDTDNLTNGCTPADFEASAYLYPGIDQELLERIANPAISGEVLEVKANAILDHERRGSFAVADVGAIGNVDAIPQAADELMQLEGITAVVVYGHTEETLHLSGRSRDDRVHMGDCLRTLTDDIPMADGGGHARMGGAQLSVEHMSGIGPSEGVSRAEFKEQVFEVLTGER